MSTHVRRGLGAVLSAALLGAGLLSLGAGVPTEASDPPAKCHQPSLDQQIKRADVVFRGQVQKVRPVQGHGVTSVRHYKVEADRVYKASLVTDTVIVTAAVGTRCPPPTLEQGKRYIVFATEHGPRLMATAATAKATKKLTHQVEAKLGDGVQPQQAPPATATFTTVADAQPPSLTRLLAPGAALLLVSLLGLLLVGRLGRRA